MLSTAVPRQMGCDCPDRRDNSMDTVVNSKWPMDQPLTRDVRQVIENVTGTARPSLLFSAGKENLLAYLATFRPCGRIEYHEGAIHILPQRSVQIAGYAVR
ncbi:hypothetical protein AVEN_192751-1 [Araneus ventricosus]|uniref:Uncharacterized protein n=1 Tax=Araneus ventricosus TaxID=182803 RepID=A0A4Y2EQ07_ARAVE|nr:hypothetical protein AVEN_192751-1 [Araneus ventricosus]